MGQPLVAITSLSGLASKVFPVIQKENFPFPCYFPAQCLQEILNFRVLFHSGKAKCWTSSLQQHPPRGAASSTRSSVPGARKGERGEFKPTRPQIPCKCQPVGPQALSHDVVQPKPLLMGLAEPPRHPPAPYHGLTASQGTRLIGEAVTPPVLSRLIFKSALKLGKLMRFFLSFLFYFFFSSGTKL